MNVVITGAGRVGYNLASFLTADGHDVTIIENDEKLCNYAASELDALIIGGNASDTNILDEANVDKADVFVASTGNDETNLLICALVKKYNIPKIIARVSDPNHSNAFKDIGVDSVINPELAAANYLEKMIIRPNIADLAVLGEGDAELLELTIRSVDIIGKRIGDLSPTDNFIIVAIYENENIVIPMPEMVLKKDMKISVLVKTTFVKEVLKRFTEL